MRTKEYHCTRCGVKLRGIRKKLCKDCHDEYLVRIRPIWYGWDNVKPLPEFLMPQVAEVKRMWNKVIEQAKADATKIINPCEKNAKQKSKDQRTARAWFGSESNRAICDSLGYTPEAVRPGAEK